MKKHWVKEAEKYELIIKYRMYVMDVEKDADIIKQVIASVSV